MTQDQKYPSVFILVQFRGNVLCRHVVDSLGGVTHTLGASYRDKFQQSERNETILVNQSVRIPSCT